jgi:hypothetical protein
MSKHTKEPWRAVHDELYKPDTDVCRIDAGHITKPVADMVAGPNARRIVDCVNFCKGIDTERMHSDMEQGVNANDQIEAMERYRERIVDLEEQRDELLAALKELVALHEPEGRFQPHHFKTPVRNAIEAIAKAEAA